MPSLPALLTSLGKVIRNLRAGAGYTQDRFAVAISRHRTYTGLLERGKANPTVRTLHMVAEGLGVSVPDLFAQAAAEGCGTLTVAGGDRLRRGKEPAILVQKPIPTAARRKGSTQVARKPGQKRRKPGK